MSKLAATYMNNQPKNHHYVPKCYLNLFTNTQNKFWKRRNDNGSFSETNPSKVCYEADANRFRTKQTLFYNNLEDEYYVEKHSFKHQENNYGKLITSVTKFQNEPKVIEKSKYRLFLETLITVKRRNPFSKNEILQRFKESYKTEDGIRNFFNFFAQETGVKDFTPEIEVFIKNYLNTESQDIDRLHDMYLSAFVNKSDYTTISQITDDLYALKQYILFAPIDQHFITSDNPGFLKVNGQAINLSGFGGDFEFIFPLSPLTCLYLKSNDFEPLNSIQKTVYNIIVDKAQVKAINNDTKLISSKYVLAYSKRTLETL